MPEVWLLLVERVKPPGGPVAQARGDGVSRDGP